MKKSNFVALGLLVVVGYFLYKSWDVFGFWTIMWTAILSIISNWYLGNSVGSRAVSTEGVTYNPKEWPKFCNILVSLAIGYYLFTIIDSPDVSKFDYRFGLTYLVLLTAIPVLFQIFILIRDRNDYISMDGDTIKYKNNSETGEIRFADIVKAELSPSTEIMLTLKNEEKMSIKTNEMNFNAIDLSKALADIIERIPEENKADKSEEPK